MRANTILESWEVKVQGWGQALRNWMNGNKWVFLSVCLLSMGLYYPIFQKGLENLDSFCTAEPYWADLWERIPFWETMQGRWALRLSDALSDGMHPYFFAVFVTTVFFLLAALLLCDLLEVRSGWIRFACAALLTCSQYVMNIQTYRYCSAAYGVSFFLAVLAVRLASRTSAGSLWGSIFCLIVSLGLYQCSLGVAAAICLFMLYRTMLQQGAFNKKCRGLLIRFLVMGVAGCILYFLVLQILLRVYRTSLAEINGINQVGFGLISQLPNGVVQAYRDFINYFVGRDISQNYYFIRPLHVVLLLVTGLMWVYQLIRNRKSLTFCVGSILIIVLLPVAANVTDLINPTTQIALRMAGAMAIVPLFCVTMLTGEIVIGRGILQKSGILLLSLALLRGYMLQSNNDIQVLVIDKTQALTVGQNILGQLVQQEEYQQGMPVAIIGTPKLMDSEYRNKANPLIRNGIFWGYAENNRDAWIRLINQELQVPMQWCSYEQTALVRETDAFDAMPLYPQAGSIGVIDDVLVVKVSE